MEKLSPLKLMRFIELERLTKNELITLCISLDTELVEIAMKNLENKKKRIRAKTDKYTKQVTAKVFEVFVDLTDKDFPTKEETELELNRRFPETKWVYDDIDPPEKDEQGFYRALVRVKKYLKFINKQQSGL